MLMFDLTCLNIWWWIKTEFTKSIYYSL